MKFIDSAIDAYAVKNSSSPSSVLNDLEHYTKGNITGANMLTGALEGSILKVLVAAIGAKKILEIGTYTGYSALTMAEAMPADGKIFTIDFQWKSTEIAKKFWDKSDHGKKIISHLGKALEILPTLSKEGPFDFVFIDADKSNYPTYLKWSFEHLAPNGIIAIDNVLWSGKVLDPKVDDEDTLAIIKATLLAQELPVFRTLLPVRDGLLLLTRNSDLLG